MAKDIRPISSEEIHDQLARPDGRPWRQRLEELSDLDGFREWLQASHPRFAAAWDAGMDRRRFLTLMGASMAVAGLSGCRIRPPEELIIPYTHQPEEIVPGRPLFFATAMTLGGYAQGLLVESHEGRPTKVEGNPNHPASLGAANALAQASLLTLCDPDRAQTTTYLGEPRSYDNLLMELRRALAHQRERQGAGLRLLTETVTSPTLAAQLQSILSAFPKAGWHQYEPNNRDQAREGARLAVGEAREAIYRFDRARVIFSLDADFLMSEPGSLRYAREFTAQRKLQGGAVSMNRLYVVEPTPSITGAMADHRLPVKAADVESICRQVAQRLEGEANSSSAPTAAARNKWIDALVGDLQQHRGASLIIAGEGQAPAVHALAYTMNQALGNIGQTVNYARPVVVSPVNQLESLRQLTQAMVAGEVELLVIISANPVYTAPADFHFKEALRKVALRIHQSLYSDETSALCHWHLPESHFLESWSDARAFDGAATIIQPLIAPLYESRSPHELLAAFSDQPYQSDYEVVRNYWRQQVTDDFERFWQSALRDGVIANSVIESTPVAASGTTQATDRQSRRASDSQSAAVPPAASLELVFRLDPSVYDGRFANNGWLQELPKPITKLTWDNAAIISPATAQRLGLSSALLPHGGEHGGVSAEIVELHYRGRMARVPIWVEPGQADDSVTLSLGYGRTRAGHLGTDVGVDAYALRTSDAPWGGAGLEIRRTGERYALACTQQHHGMEGRDLVRLATLEEYRRHPEFARRDADDPQKAISLYPQWPYPDYAWGMAIDLNSCIGCNACVVACQSENNIPIVGKEQVLRAREMHWLRIDRYTTGAAGTPSVAFMPVPCMHCENAPCELVCPVEATSHSEDGLNEMTYNRCVGTRYCSNNCPYKVRRFNFFQYADFETPVLKLHRNPDVTVRSRGVMEKCTYCVQRIRAAQIEAEQEDRAVRDGEVVTACQAACPTEAITFGNLNDTKSRVAALKVEPRNFALLGELNTRPRTSYLAIVRNPNPEMRTE